MKATGNSTWNVKGKITIRNELYFIEKEYEFEKEHDNYKVVEEEAKNFVKTILQNI